jgi:hypothetical protein
MPMLVHTRTLHVSGCRSGLRAPSEGANLRCEESPSAPLRGDTSGTSLGRTISVTGGTYKRRPIFLVLALNGCEPSPSFVDESYKEGTPYLNGSRRFLIPYVEIGTDVLQLRHAQF